ncbi:Zn-dependent peptidase ImmA (M78 family)/transcriptional regulator with XRE-family HTH domain [Actinokineospora baliensis]|uniref:helix-turn-helix domain-containing protein n=1 Tax=Actinokineospora baliensis TaxID=547056 RepID=UPI00195A6371|nr:XRE family transcriptional regulator [Actinokineospora baliensis]MBM7772351.1 Zn-dependent peptidase ImmA (M78 family)/transcriptional regulator with XRE-family HTH domain [Actinokineospora baliensis]
MSDSLWPDEPGVNPQVLVAAREALGWTQGQLADRLSELSGARPKISQGYVSRVEKGVLSAQADRAELFAAALGCTVDLLVSEAKLWSLGDGCLYHRNRTSTKSSTLRRLHAQVNLVRLALHRLAAAVGVELPVFDMTPMPVGGLYGPSDAARAVRESLGLGKGAVESVTGVAERLGVLVVPMSLGGREVDATSLHPPGEAPIFVVNTDAPTDRQRFTLAHELGHLVCAPEVDLDVEEMAQAFAAELLAPAREVRVDLAAAPITPARLLQLKSVWRVSAAALLRRAVDLAVVTDSRYRTVSAQMSALGWRSTEPDPLPRERTRVVPALLASSVADLGGPRAAAGVAGAPLEVLRGAFGVGLVDGEPSEGSGT